MVLWVRDQGPHGVVSPDQLYALALSRALSSVASPCTVGLYSSCPDRSRLILQSTQVHMDQEARRIEQQCRSSRPRPVKPSLSGLVSLLFKLLFYRPVWARHHQQEHIRFLYVDFSAWHFAGSDLLWAGLVLRLCHAMQVHFGRLPMSLYRTVQYHDEDEVHKKVVADGPSGLRPKMLCCCPLWFFVLSLLVSMVIICIALALFGFPVAESEGFLVDLFKNLLRSPDRNIHSVMDNTQVSRQLGFMNQVRKEMWVLSNFVRFMELYEGRRIRIVIKITELDRCSPTKIVSVLEAINILLSDQDSPFLLILAVDPEVIVQKVNYADSCFCREDRAYAFLNRIVTLSFTIPPLTEKSKRKVFHGLVHVSDVSEKRPRSRGCCDKSTQDESLVEKAEAIYMPLMGPAATAVERVDEDVENLISAAFSSFLSDGGRLNKFLSDDSMSMRRVINSIRVTVTIMKYLNAEVPTPENMAAWVVLANYWPCRLSWLLNCLEDDQQRLKIDPKDAADSLDYKTLWQVFRESRVELYMIRDQIDDLLEQDGDPEMFELLLKSFPFTVKDVEVFVPATVNLDLTIRKELGQIRGVSKLQDSGWNGNVVPLPFKTIVNMSVDDVCSELERMHLNADHAKVLRDNHLNGLALVFGDADQLKSLFHMTLGQWTAFRLRFLGFPPDPRQTARNPRTTHHSLASAPHTRRHDGLR
ncbi:hypothetical protein NHX12_005471 [Muraenolepis orangiensis]|uniref:KAP NTPase domain-containing protein n=1 Tax=Muraenolepis orangiensis TaxID=630683 RepID=A0A9Q0DU00_9TELE|nr:hypothetical protein NHX12_005471 [Muraenolepis orangiensis]